MNALKEYIVSKRRYFHMYPELGYDTYKTAEYIYNELLTIGYKPKYLLNKTAVIARLDLKKEKTLAFRSDMDALNIKEINDLEYKSKNDYMHACGHDAHMAMLLGVAKKAYEEQKDLEYNLVFIFQPAEEGPLPGGAIKVIETNELQNIDAFFAYHVTNKYNTNTAAIKIGPATSAPDLFDIIIHGKGCHGSTPKLGINPNIIASKIVISLNNLYENLLKTNPFVVISTTTISSNGAYNIIPDTAYIKGTARSFTNEERNNLKNQMQEIINSISKEYNIIIEFKFHFAYDPVYNDEKLARMYIDAAKTHLDNILILDEPEMIGEDFSYYRQIAPICLVWLGVKKENQIFTDLHSPKFTLDENALLNGVISFIEITKKN